MLDVVYDPAIMPTLRNPKHEQFAQNLAGIGKTGGTQGNAYTHAGYRCENGEAEAAASRMLADVRNGVADRVSELMSGGAKRVEVTVASLLAELEQARVAAHDDGKFSASVQAIAGKARLSGLDRAENGGNGNGSIYAKCETTEQVMATLVAECGSAAQALAEFDELREMLTVYAGDHADLIPAAERARRRPDEAALSLALLRPGRR